MGWGERSELQRSRQRIFQVSGFAGSPQPIELLEEHARMKMIAIMAVVATLFMTIPSHATSVCLDSSVHEKFNRSNVVVVATVEAKSIKRSGGGWRQTILWRVDENWKGVRYKGSTFTTRVMMTSREDVAVGQGFLLMLNGREPYEWITCDKDRGLLQKSLEDVREVQDMFDKQRQP